MIFELKIRFVILDRLDPFLSSIPSRSVVTISPLFQGKYRLLEQRRKFLTSENERKENSGTRDNTADRRGKWAKMTNLIFNSKIIILNETKKN